MRSHRFHRQAGRNTSCGNVSSWKDFDDSRGTAPLWESTGTFVLFTGQAGQSTL